MAQFKKVKFDILTGQTRRKPKGGPLVKKIICSKKFSESDQSRLKWSGLSCWFQKHIDQWFLTCARPMHAPCTLSARSVHGPCTGQKSMIYMFLESAWQTWLFEPILVEFWELFWKKYFFPQGSPLWFLPGLSANVCLQMHMYAQPFWMSLNWWQETIRKLHVCHPAILAGAW